jgi:L-threonylcarbamoyladenylate synthase
MSMTADIDKATEVLRDGGIILYPTDTIWGLGCDAMNSKSVERIYEIKQRSDSKAMLVLLGSENLIYQYVIEIPEIAYQLIEVADKPLTIIFPGAKNLASNLIADDGSIGIRIPNDEFCQMLLSRFKKPIVSTSANLSGKISPLKFSEIDENIIKSVDYVVGWKQDDAQPGSSSSIIKLGLGGEIQIIRR